MTVRDGEGKFANLDVGQREARVIQYAREDGLSARKIAPLTGFSHGHVCRILRRYGIKKRKGKPKEKTVASDFPGSEYTDEDRRFLIACERYRQQSGKKFLAATDYLKILKGLGYRRGS